ncbi:mavicyanin-like [Trifolium medium]|uniref:Mavicyanin-like n=1 Tax=Trifolium medium TaxID=97028 RepID=A0A392QCR5_9FABA|nr:mavicyanin-like [Trifolium medium]
MAFVEKAVVLLMVIMVAAEVSNAAEYKVGDSAGWTTIGDINYKKWAAEKKFKIGDTISHAMHQPLSQPSPVAMTP